jgi:hypothetical protein
MKQIFNKIFILCVAFLCVNKVASQGSFVLSKNVSKESVSFQLLSNLIVFPLEINGKKLNFILDSGVGSTILFSLTNADSIPLKNLEKIKLQGLGSEDPVDAVLSKGNTFKIKGLTGLNQSLYVIFDDSFDLSSKLGLTIHGIIGYELLKNFAVTINYSSKRITFSDFDNFKFKNCSKCEKFPLDFYKLKPFVTANVKMNKNAENSIPVKLLIDSGGSDALWLFEDSKPEIKIPDKYFNDYLGEGLSGTIFGKRSKIPLLKMGNFELNEPNVAFPDSASISFARKFKERNGSIGGAVLKRFDVTFNYKESYIGLKKRSAFKEPFNYNRSGIELVYNGKILVQEKDYTTFSLADGQKSSNNNRINLAYNYKYTFKPSYKIFKIRENSPAERAGLLPGDIVIKINGKYTFDLKFEEIVHKFYLKEGKKIELVVERNGKDYEFEFYLEDLL